MNDKTLENVLNETAANTPDESPVASSLQQKAEGVNAPPPQVPSVSENNSLDKSPKKRGRPPKDPNAPPKPPKAAGFVGGAARSAPPLDPDQARVMAERKNLSIMCVGLMEQTGSMLAGDRAKMGALEAEALSSNFERYFTAKNISDLPVGVALALGIGSYYAKLLQTEEAQPKVQKFGLWIVGKWQRLRGKKYGARFDRRDDTKRENNADEETDTSIQNRKSPFHRS